MQLMHSGAKRILMVALGTLFLVLGMVGIFLPVLPTTPFLLLAAFFYLRGSHRLYRWLTGHKVFGRYITDYMTYHSIRRHVKITALAFLWFSLALSMLLVPVVTIRILLAVIGIAVSIHIIMLRTLSSKPDPCRTGSPTEAEREDQMN